MIWPGGGRKGRVLFVILLSTLVMGCSLDKTDKKKTDKKVFSDLKAYNGSFFLLNPQSLLMQDIQQSAPRIVDENGQPIADAQVLIGDQPGNPFDGNTLFTNGQGYIEIPSEWKTPLPMTVTAAGYVRTTFFNVEPQYGLYHLALADGTTSLQISGKTTGFGQLRRDGNVDVGLIMPALTRSQLLHFSLDEVLSPKNDTVDVGLTDFKVPSNVTLPRQTESYIIPITLDKEQYRSFVRRPGFYRFVAIHVQFPLRRVVDDIRSDKSMFDVINYFKVLSGGITDLQVNQSVANKDLPVNQWQNSGQMTVQAPQFASDKIMITLALADKDGYLILTDIKSLKSGESLTLKAMAGSQKNAILSVLVHQSTDSSKAIKHDATGRETINLRHFFTGVQPESEKMDLSQMSFVLQAPGKTPIFLPDVAKPVVSANQVTLVPPPAVPTVTPLATYLVYSQIEKIQDGDDTSTKVTRLWELTAKGWVKQVALPKIDLPRDKDKTYRWEVMFLGRDASLAPAGDNSLDQVTHVTRSYIDL